MKKFFEQLRDALILSLGGVPLWQFELVGDMLYRRGKLEERSRYWKAYGLLPPKETK